MPFESLSYRYIFNFTDFPNRWLPLIHLYDPDLPLFPVYYFHVLPDNLPEGHRPSEIERAYGYIEKINLTNTNIAEVSVILNKNLDNPANQHYLNPVLNAARERFGLNNPVTHNHVQNAFVSPLDSSNEVLSEIWLRVISSAYGNKLPFGRLWDEVLGLARFVASWFSSGRKGELIQTHYFASKFGVKIQSGGGIPQMDFFLLPTINEIVDLQNPLTIFPQYRELLNVARRFQNNYCTTMEIDGIHLSKFINPVSRQFDTAALLEIFRSAHIPYDIRPAAFECFNSFAKGPQRTIIFLMMLDDLRNGRLSPASLSSSMCGSIYDGLAGSYQAPKTIQIYAQQSFGNESAMPVDTWVKTFLKWPLKVWPLQRMRNKYEYIFGHSQNLGKVERLIWVSAQARKVHSSACNDALWCIKKGSSGPARGANPLACNICLESIRSQCPAYRHIRDLNVYFNSHDSPDSGFHITTSSGNNTTPNQSFVKCEGNSIYGRILDDFSPADDPEGFAPFPDPDHGGDPITVDEFVQIY